jgi:hypothetical protein
VIEPAKEYRLELHAGFYDEARVRALLKEHQDVTEAISILEREGPGEAPATNGGPPDADATGDNDEHVYELNPKIFEVAEWIDEPDDVKQITPRGVRWHAMIDCEMRRLRALGPHTKGQCDAACDFLLGMSADERDTRSFLMMTSTAFEDARYYGPTFLHCNVRDQPLDFTASVSRQEWNEFDLAYQRRLELDDIEHVAARWFCLVEQETGRELRRYVEWMNRWAARGEKAEPKYSAAQAFAIRALLEPYCGEGVRRGLQVAQWEIAKLLKDKRPPCPRCNGQPHYTDHARREAFDRKWAGAATFRNTFERKFAAHIVRRARAKGWHSTGDAEFAYGDMSFENAPHETQQDKGKEWADPEPLTAPLPEVLEFTADLFPDSVAKWARGIIEDSGTSAAFVWAALMVALASMIGRRLGIRPKRFDKTWIVICNLWGMVIGRPGSMKSPPVHAVLRPLRSLGHAAMLKWKAEMKAWEAEQRARKQDQQRKKGRHDLGDDNPDAPPDPKPIAKRYTVTNITTEKLGGVLTENPNGVLIDRDELIGFLRGLERKGYEHARGFLLETWEGNSTGTFDTINRGTVYVPAMCVSIIGTISPGPLNAYLTEAFGEDRDDDGFMQRFQLAVWPDPPKSALGKDKPRDDTTRWRARSSANSTNSSPKTSAPRSTATKTIRAGFHM